MTLENTVLAKLAEWHPPAGRRTLTVPDEAAAKTFARNDPYAKAGLFETTEIKKWRWSIKPPAKA